LLIGIGYPRSQAAKMIADQVVARDKGDLNIAPEVLGGASRMDAAPVQEAA
jgi:hypothetical protein